MGMDKDIEELDRRFDEEVGDPPQERPEPPFNLPEPEISHEDQAAAIQRLITEWDRVAAYALDLFRRRNIPKALEQVDALLDIDRAIGGYIILGMPE